MNFLNCTYEIVRSRSGSRKWRKTKSDCLESWRYVVPRNFSFRKIFERVRAMFKDVLDHLNIKLYFSIVIVHKYFLEFFFTKKNKTCTLSLNILWIKHCTDSFKYFSYRNKAALFEFNFIIFQYWLLFEIFRLKVVFPYDFTFIFNSKLNL